MPFIPFTTRDFSSMASVTASSIPTSLEAKINYLRNELGEFPEYKLDFFRNRIVRRPTMKGKTGLVFGPPKSMDNHWYLYIVGGDQDQVQLNIGMGQDHIRVGMGFMIGRQVRPKIPAFHILQTFLGVRPPIPFRDAFYQCIKRNGFQIEGEATKDANEIINILETYVIPADDSSVFIFIGKLWDISEAVTKVAEDYRNIFLELLPFYEELILAGGRYTFNI